MSDVDTLAKQVMEAGSAETRTSLFAKMTPDIKKQVRVKVRELIAAGKQPEEKKKEDDEDDDIDWDAVSKPSGGVQGGAPVNIPVTVRDTELDALWEAMDSDTMMDFDDSAASAFDYVGFNPREVGRQIISRGKRAGLNDSQIRKDVNTMVSAAHKKGTINDHNYQKMSKAGQTEYNRLETLYQLKKGGSKGVPAETITIARVGAAFPGRVMRLLQADKVKPKTFQGGLKSSTLPSVMQTQAFPACIPSTLAEVARDAVFQFSRAYSTDQTIALSQQKTKPSVSDAWNNQLNFVSLTRDASYPSEDNRISMFKQIDWATAYLKTETCRKAIQGVDNTISFPSHTEFLSAVQKL